MQVAVVLEHACVHYIRIPYPVELIKAFAVERLGDLDGAVTAEVEENDAVSVLDCADRLAVAGDDKWRQILVDNMVTVAVGIYGIGGGRELLGVAQHMRMPTALYHWPVGLIAVHGDFHAAAARGDHYVKIGCA